MSSALLRGPALSILALLASCGLASPVFGQTFVFANTCGTGTWGGYCTAGGGNWQSNWGVVGPNPATLMPGAADTCLISGTVTLDVSPTITSLTVPAGSVLIWPSATLNVGTLSNSGTVSLTQGFNKFLTGNSVNNTGASWDVSAGSFYFQGAALVNHGSITLSGGGSLRRNGGVASDNTLTNNGTVHIAAIGPGSAVSGLTLIGSPSGLWVTDLGATLSLDGVAFSGTLAGDHDGATTMSGTNTLAADTTFSTVIGSNPWGWSSAILDTGSFTLTNAGSLRLDTGLNKFFSGTAVNASTGDWAVAQGNFYFSPGPTPSTITNDGIFELGLNAGVRRNGGAIENAVLSSSGTVRATQLGAAISDITLVSDGGTWETVTDASLKLSGVRLSGTFLGSHTGSTTMEGAVTLAGDTVFASVPGSPNPWGWSSASMNTGAFTFTNTGRMEANTGLNKFLTGSAANSTGATWAFMQGNFYLSPAVGVTTLTNNGAVAIAGGASVLRNGGAIANARFVNGGAVTSLGAGASVQNVSITSNSGTWRTGAGTSLLLSDTQLAGTFIGDHGGDGTLGGTMLLTADATFTTLVTSVAPWQWTTASIDANGFTLTNTGRMETTTGLNKFMSGSVVNAAGATWTGMQGNFYLSPSGSTGFAHLTNNGTLTLNNGTSLLRNGGTPATAVFTNNGLLLVTAAGSNMQSPSVYNNAAGVIRIDPSATLTLPNDWSGNSGRLEGSGQFTSAGLGIVNSSGTVAPGIGAATGTLSSNFRYNQTADGTLEIAVVSNGVTQSADKLSLTGGGFNAQASLGGTLRVVLPAGTAPPPIGGTQYVIVDAPGGLTGSFASIVDADPIAEYRYTVTYTATQAILHILHRCGGADVGGTGADTNFDGVLDNNDFVVFIDLFFNQNPTADVGSVGGVFGPDGAWDNNDFVVFIDMFFSGCQ